MFKESFGTGGSIRVVCSQLVVVVFHVELNRSLPFAEFRGCISSYVLRNHCVVMAFR
jgi:hypothetical protein